MAQLKDFHYLRPIDKVTDQWHSLALPDDIYGKVSAQLSDIRIIEINGADTLEVPYLIKKPRFGYEEFAFEVINQTRTGEGFYYTFKVDPNKAVDHIRVNFGTPNFDLSVTLEGSQDQREWFGIVEDYRILSIKNNLTDYQFTTIRFPTTQFGYYRLFVPAAQDPDFMSAEIRQSIVSKIEYRRYEPTNTDIIQNTQNNETVINVSFKMQVPISSVRVEVADSVDYYRPVTIEYLTDSFETEKGWRYNYQTLDKGTLSSLEDNEFRFKTTVLQKLKLIIADQDNRPLSVKGVKGKGEVRQLIARFTGPGDYYLLYGNSNARKPSYDIKNFESSIPAKLKPLEFGDELSIQQIRKKTKPLFESQWWFWLIMLAVMGLLGWFSLKMVKGK